MKHFDIGSILVIVLTFLLFVAALFFTGFTHDLLLEAGVFLISVKLVIMAYKTSKNSKEIDTHLLEIIKLIKQNNKKT